MTSLTYMMNYKNAWHRQKKEHFMDRVIKFFERITGK